MTEKEFLDKLLGLKLNFYKERNPEDVKKEYWNSYGQKFESFNPDHHKFKTPLSLDHVLKESWISGGVSGGSCWDDGTQDNHYAMTGEPEPDFTEIDTILENICPDISFLKYKKFMSELNIQRDSYSENEYYGNSTMHSYKFVTLRDLFKAINDLMKDEK